MVLPLAANRPIIIELARYRVSRSYKTVLYDELCRNIGPRNPVGEA
jgi:hypothetical protein